METTGPRGSHARCPEGWCVDRRTPTHTHPAHASGGSFRLGPSAGWTVPGFGRAQCGLDPRGKEPGVSLSPELPHGLEVGPEAGPEGGFGSPPPTERPVGSRLALRADART